MNYINLTFHFIFYILSIIIPLGIGQLANNFLLKKRINEIDIGFIGIFGFFTLYFLSSVFHLILPINDTLTILILILGLISFIVFTPKIFFIKNIKLLLLVSILLYPLTIIFYVNEDFFFYYFPYLNYLISSKIIFGLVNINDILAYSTNSLYDIYVFFRIPYFINNGYAIPNVSFYIFSIIFLIKICLDTKKIFFVIILIFSIITFNKLRDFGTVVPSQLLLILSSCLVYHMYIVKYNDSEFAKLFCLITFAIILRFNSIIIFPIILIFFILNFYKIFIFLKNFKLYIFFVLSTFVLFIIKNIIISGCIIYPLYFSCIDKLSWSPSNDLTKLKYEKLQADSKGWSFYAKEQFNIDNKFVWQNLQKDNFKSVHEYTKTYPTFWLKYWIKDHDHKKIINLFLVSIFIFFVILLSNIKKIRIKYNFNKNTSLFFLSILLTSLFWINVSPQTRYGGFFISIILFGFITASLLNIFINNNKNWIAIFILFIISIGYVEIKNIARITNDFSSNNNNNFPWPNYQKLNENEDYIVEKLNFFNLQKRIKTNKLIFDNDSDYLLMCGDIPFPCVPIKKEVCMGQVLKINSYLFVYKNNNITECSRLINNNILY